MKIYSMTATFGKLENQTLTLQPGLNIISAPNEWGKSTWCAFLVNMLYGLETRVKTTRTNTPDKERYAPWSGSPMSGRIDLNWNGRDITIERWTKGRTPMGEFRAFETESGITVPELTATTCGEMLLGVERSVFLRSGFLRLTDLPVTEDDALRRRLNALVTTGDESGAADDLAQKLKDLKNKCRSNRTNGLIPQAEAEKAAIEEKLRQIALLQQQSQENARRRQELLDELAKLQNHQIALEYAAGEENNRRILRAQLRRDEALERLEMLTAQCRNLPDLQQAKHSADRLRQLHQDSVALDLEQQMLPQMPALPVIPNRYEGLSGDAAIQMAGTDAEAYRNLETGKKKRSNLFTGFSVACMVAAILLIVLQLPSFGLWLWVGIALLAAGALTLAAAFLSAKRYYEKINTLFDKYPGIPAKDWVSDARRFAWEQECYAAANENYQQTIVSFRQKREALTAELQTLTQGQRVSDCLQQWESVAKKWEELSDARRIYDDARTHAETIAAMAKPLPQPAMPDDLTCSADETCQLIEETRRELQLLQQRQGQYQGLMEAMGQETVLRRQLDGVNGRLDRLADTYAALELAQATLAAATAELQRRFAPRIAQEAQRILGRLTDGRYDRLTISQDLTLSTATGEETVLRAAQRRSEGTVDQIYLALRLAVSRELTPDAPFVLDDALVRFDDIRHAAAMDILREEAENRQIILFSCQTREKENT